MGVIKMRFMVVFCVVLLLGLCTGCSRPYFQEYRTVTDRQYHIHLLAQQLSSSGVIILATPQDMTLVIPGRMLFIHNSHNFTDSAYPHLQQITNFLKYFETVDIQVLGFANQRDLENNAVLAALTRSRAQKVAEYLWSHEVDVRLLAADGYELKTMRQGKIVLSDCIVIYFPRI